MDYRWRYQDTQGRDTTGPDVEFTDQTEAEQWLSGSWSDLLDSGVEQVTLLRSESEVYGPMGLRSAS